MTELRIRALAKGLATRVPGLRAFACRHSGGTESARYCYSVWLRHLVMAGNAGVSTRPHRVAELGPGDSFGIGLAAMLSGADHYLAFDAKPHARVERNLSVFAELVELFTRHVPIPDQTEFPEMFPRLECYDFPRDLLPDTRLAAALQPDRLTAIRRALSGDSASGSPIEITYLAPWDEVATIRPGTVDMVISQAVLEHVEDPNMTYAALGRWLCQGGIMSHSIDFQSHGLTDSWNGHWTLGDLTWQVVKGDRPYLLNRLPYSAHLAMIERFGFRLVTNRRYEAPALARQTLSPRFRSLPDEDLITASAFVQAEKVADTPEPGSPGG
jgi:hypothetical protein